MSPAERNVFLICADPGVTGECIREIASTGGQYQLPLAASAELARQNFRAQSPTVIFLDESAVNPERREETLASAVALLTEWAPVVVAAAPEKQSDLAFLITSGAVDFVSRTDQFLPIVVGLLERRVRLAERAEGLIHFSGEELEGDFGEVLRHEVNNPLTGILGNAELLLARRDRLPPTAVGRLQTIAELAVRLRDTVRRLSNAWETRHDHARSA
ncbi:MAG: histidine kinase dimerization/phospho-acceptor domain-containing protein [Candidatus Acidiferrales bacterium]